MTAFLDEIEALIDVSTDVGSGSSWPIYKSHLPDSTVIGDKAIALLETPGEGETGRVDIDKRGLKVLVRGSPMSSESTSYETTEAIAISIRDDMVGYAGSSDTSSHHYVGIWSLDGPTFQGFDASWRPLLAMNFRAWRSKD